MTQAKWNSKETLTAFTRQYDPCEIGLHIMRLDEEARFGPHVTFKNLTLPTPELAKQLWAVAARECFEPEDARDGDFFIDLYEGDGLTETAWMQRQMLPRLEALHRSILAKEPAHDAG